MSFCTNCSVPLSPGHPFCTNCGSAAPQPQPQQVQAVPSPGLAPVPATAPAAGSAAVGGQGIPLCLGCGAHAPTGRTECVLCQHQFGAQPWQVPPNPDGTYWCGVQTTFRCGACNRDSPLNHLDLDGHVTCLQCGVEQRYDIDIWGDGLELGHNIADLAGPNPLGRQYHPPSQFDPDENPFVEIGRQYTHGTEETMMMSGSGTSQLTFKAFPGHPLCGKCKSPYRIVSRDQAVLTVQCPACQEVKRHALPPEVHGRFKGIVGTIGADVDADMREARVNRDPGGAVAICCPQCSAPLDVAEGSTIVHCGFCRTNSRLTPATLRDLGRSDAKVLTWWLLLEGKSPQRVELENDYAEERREQAEAYRVQTARSDSLDPHVPQAAKSNAPNAGAVRSIAAAGVMVMASAGAFIAMRAGGYEEDESDEVAAAAVAPPKAVKKPKPVVPLSLTWTGKLVEAEGKKLKKGAACKLTFEGTNKRVSQLQLRCGGRVLYDTKTPVAGMSQLGWRLYERPDAGGWAYTLNYQDTGSRTGRPQATLDTRGAKSAIFDNAAEKFRVKIKFDPYSSARQGEPLYATPRAFVNVARKAEVSSVSGAKPPVAKGAQCNVKLTPSALYEKQAICKTEIRCGAKVIYGTGTFGYAACTLDDKGNPIAFKDDDFTSTGGDPKLDLSLATLQAKLSDDPDAGQWDLTLAIEPE